jgi:hypothetical protein
MPRTNSFDDIQDILSTKGFMLIRYVTARKMESLCKCGSYTTMQLASIKNGVTCNDCRTSPASQPAPILSAIDIPIINNHIKSKNRKDIVTSITEDEQLTYTCGNCGHEGNVCKRYTLESKKNDVCPKCKNRPKCFTKQPFDAATKIRYLQEQSDEKGHTCIVLSVTEDRGVTYKCGNTECAKICKTDDSGFKRKRTNCCNSCQNDKNKREIIEVEEELKLQGLQLVSYINNKSIVAICPEPCNMKFNTCMNAIRRGRLCIDCKTDRMKATSLQVYGYDNPSKAPEIIQKISDTNMTRRGYKWPQQDPEVRQKTINTCMLKFQKKFSFCQDWVYTKIKAIHKENCGFEYPLQSKEIQKKGEETCLEHHGVSRYMLSKDFAEKAKATMIKLYNVEYALQCPEFFHKAMKSGFSTKEYKLPKSGIVINLMGYEHFVMDHLLKNNFNHPLFGNGIVVQEENILTNKYVSNFPYIMNDKNHVYYPDFAIVNTDIIIEVKSPWTLMKDLNKNLIKFTTVSKTTNYTMYVFIMKKSIIDDIWKFQGNTRGISIFNKNIDLAKYKMPNDYIPTEEDMECIDWEMMVEAIEEMPIDIDDDNLSISSYENDCKKQRI